MAEAKEVRTKKTKVATKEKPLAAKPAKKVVKGKQDGIIEKNSKIAVETASKTEEVTATTGDKNIQATAKAGKRSAKSLKEEEERQAKEARKAESAKVAGSDTAKDAPKQKQRSAEDRLKSRGKNYRKVYGLVDKSKTYSLNEALELAAKTSPVKFDAAVELHIRLNVDPKQADQNLRDTIVLPSGSGRTVRIAVFADADGAKAAIKAGADIAAADEFLQQLDKGQLDFDILISTPANMPKLGKYARVLGPKGLMPNPKSGTVTNDIVKAVGEAKSGRVEYRVDSTGIIHLGIGKVSFGAQKLSANAQAVLASIKANKPASIKSTFVRSIYVSTSMGPSIQVENQAGQ